MVVYKNIKNTVQDLLICKEFCNTYTCCSLPAKIFKKLNM